MLKNGYTQEFADRVFSQICGFGEYGFPESHSASFALLAYVSAWIKHYEPAAFLARCSTASRWVSIRLRCSCRMRSAIGVEVRPVDVTVSASDCTLEPDGRKPACASA
jgi:error-prone DNA polymerase